MSGHSKWHDCKSPNLTASMVTILKEFKLAQFNPYRTIKNHIKQ